MMFFLAGLSVLLGACLGSFANVVVIRLKEGSSLGGRSHCPRCKKPIRPWHLIPIVSWFWLRGKCFDCGKPIHWQYPVVESVMAILTLVIFLRHIPLFVSMQVLTMGIELALSFSLLVVAAFDLRWQLVPIEFTVITSIIVGLLRLVAGASLTDVALGALSVAAAIWLFVALSRGTMMGEGDPFVGLLIGAALGFPLGLIGLLLAFIIGGSVSLALLLQGAVTRKTPVPFVPFLAAGALVALWWQDPLLSYLSYAFF